MTLYRHIICDPRRRFVYSRAVIGLTDKISQDWLNQYNLHFEFTLLSNYINLAQPLFISGNRNK